MPLGKLKWQIEKNTSGNEGDEPAVKKVKKPCCQMLLVPGPVKQLLQCGQKKSMHI